MEFLTIMAIGTLIAVWAVIASRPKQQARFGDEVLLPHDSVPTETPPWKKDIARSHPIGELDYLEGVERYQDDPVHQPFPLPPPRNTRDKSFD